MRDVTRSSGEQSENELAGPARQALERLIEGNRRYCEGRPMRPNQDAARRCEVASGQHPFAVILGCADSRVAPEIIFDQGLGDLFVVRVAGNAAHPITIESIGYAAEHLGVRLVLVLGHSRCGAVTAAVETYGKKHEEVGSLVSGIWPAVASARAKPGDTLANAVADNVRMVVQRVRQCEEMGAAVRNGEIAIIGGRYDLASGRVEIFAG